MIETENPTLLVTYLPAGRRPNWNKELGYLEKKQ